MGENETCTFPISIQGSGNSATEGTEEMGEEEEMGVLRSCILHIETFSPVKRRGLRRLRKGHKAFPISSKQWLGERRLYQLL